MLLRQTPHDAGFHSGSLAALPGFLFLVLVDRNRIQILCLKNLTAVKATHILDPVAAVEELGSLVLTTLHSEITPILD